MTYYYSRYHYDCQKKYEWSAFAEKDLVGSGNVGCGTSFKMPAGGAVCMSTWDGDSYLSGDEYHNENASDSSGQQAYIDGASLGAQMYAESYHVLHGSDGKTYYLIEIEVEGCNNVGDYFAFYGDVPPAGTDLHVVNTCNVTGNLIKFDCLATCDTAPPNTPPEFSNAPGNCITVDENTTFVIDLDATDAEGDALSYAITGGADSAFFEIDAHTGELSFKAAPDYEAPADHGADNVYEVKVEVSDGKGGTETKLLKVCVKDVDEGTPGTGTCIVVEAEDMHERGFHTVSGSQASGGKLVKLGYCDDGKLWTTFNGADGTYDLKVFAQDENDGQSCIDVYVNGHKVDTIKLNRDSDGGGSNNGGFSEFVIEDLNLKAGDQVKLVADAKGGEYVRLDKIEFCGEAAPQKGSIGDTVWFDADGDGIQDAGEAGVASVSVKLIDAATGDVIATQTTDSNGNYLFEDVAAGDYKVAFELPAGSFAFTTEGAAGSDEANDSDAGADGMTGVFSLAAGEDRSDVDAGIVDTTPPGGECITIEAEDMHERGYKTVSGSQASGGKLVKLDCAGGDGKLWTYFNGESDTYDLTIHAQDESDGQSTIKVLVNGHVVDTIKLDRDSDGGGSNNGGFSEFVIEDIQINHGDKVKLVAYGDHGEYVRIDKIELCKDGEICPEGFTLQDFSSLGEGTIVAGQIDGVTISAQRDGDGANSPNDAMIFDSANPTGGDHDLGFANQGSILIISEDGDSHDPDDNAGGGVITFDFDNPSDLSSIKLLDIEESGGSIKLFDADGNVIKTVSIPAAGNNSIQTVDLDATGVAKMEIHLVGSGAVDDLCWKPGEAPQLGAIGDTVFFDADGDGIQDAGESGVANVTVTLLDGDGNEVANQNTDGNGNYLFEGLAAGDYKVVFDLPTGGFAFTTPNNETGPDGDAGDSDADAAGMTDTITLAAGETDLTVDAGIVELPGSLSGRYFCDTNDNDVDDGQSVDPGIKDVVVTLFDAAGNEVATTTTGDEGLYSFTGLEPGTYSVQFTDPNGVLADKTLVNPNVEDQTTAEGSGDEIDSDAIGDTTVSEITGIVVNAGQDTPNNDAGAEYTRASLGDKVWLDANRNGIQDDGDDGVAGVTVTLIDGGADGLIGTTDDVDTRTVTTGNDGLYLFDDLVPGREYQVMFSNLPAGFAFTTQDVDGNVSDDADSDVDETTGKSQVVTLTPGEENLTVDAGVVVSNEGPVANPDSRTFCTDAEEAARTIAVTANDTDADGDTLSIAKVNGIDVQDGDTLTIDGVDISVSGGSLIFDGTTAFADLEIGQQQTRSYTYTVTDGIETDSSTVDATFCGTKNTLETIDTDIADVAGTFTLTLEGLDEGVEGSYYDLTISETDDARFDGIEFEDAYCTQANLPSTALTGSVPFEMHVAEAGLYPSEIIAFEQTGPSPDTDPFVPPVNSLTDEQKLNAINWILNQDFDDQDNGDGPGETYTEAEIQGAIWGFTDDFLFVNTATQPGTIANATEIYNDAVTNGTAFKAESGDIVGLLIDPVDDAEQGFIIGVEFDALAQDCVC